MNPVATEILMHQSPPIDDALLRDLLAEIRSRRAEFEAQQFISQDIVERFRTLGVYRALVARRFGGDERSPAEFCRLVETIAQADGSAGWVSSFGIGAVYLSALPVDTLHQLYERSPDVVFAGGIFPPRPAQVVDGGLKVNGRWSWASGCMGADVVGVGVAPKDGDTVGLPRMAVMPRAAARVERNWDVVGLLGTGSHDLVVEDVIVPESWTFVRGGKSALDEPLYRYPTLAFAAQVLSVVGLGIARAALDEVETMGGRQSVTGAPKLGDRVAAQLDIAKAEADLRSARSWFYEAIDTVWQVLLSGGEPAPHQVSLLRLSSTHATRVSAEVTRRAQMLTGMTGVYESSPLARQVRDAQMITQHAFMGDVTYQNAGAMLFGLSPQPGYL
ncbi:acyl-CoA dehydrogenase [Azospirillum sp. TSO35-2]|nr:acyl-CoA dehydrogenase [Azospirillum sp. TSO35-2]